MRVAALAALAVVLAAPAAASAARGAAAPKPITIRVGDFYFRPALTTVKVGQTVRFVNIGKIDHTVADTDSRWRIRSKLIHPRDLARGETQTVRFSKPGVVYYLCTFHPTLMRGKLVVAN